jgi:hypothetical protein
VFEQDLSIGAIFRGTKYQDVPSFRRATLRARSYQVFFPEAATSVIRSLSQEILNFSMYILGCKVALEQDLSIGAIFRRKNYLDVPVIWSTGPNGM